MKRKITLFMLIGLLMTVSCATAQRIGRWEKLGEKGVSIHTERDVIRAAHKGFFSKIKINVKGNPIEVKKVIVRFLDGSSKTLRLRHHFRPGSDSRIIDLPGNKRIIREIIIYHKAKSSHGNRPSWRPPHRPGNPRHRPVASISVWGRH